MVMVVSMRDGRGKGEYEGELESGESNGEKGRRRERRAYPTVVSGEGLGRKRRRRRRRKKKKKRQMVNESGRFQTLLRFVNSSEWV
jgi:hypothetical protein